jgi:DNA mismatch repair protein MutS
MASPANPERRQCFARLRLICLTRSDGPDDPARRTFEIILKPAYGLAYALSLALKRGVTYEQLRKRVRP